VSAVVWEVADFGSACRFVKNNIISLYKNLLGREKGYLKKDWGGKISIALAYPNSYRVGMSNMGFQVVYQFVNRRSDVVAERVFLPQGRELDLYRKTGAEIRSVESQVPLQKFDIIAFSIPFENDYLNVLRILELGRIPVLADERSDSWPFVMAGGVTTFLNPEPLSMFVDFFLLGEAEANLDRFIDLFVDVVGLYDKNRNNRTKQEIISYLNRHEPSLYVPSLYTAEYDSNGTLKAFVPKNGNSKKTVDVAKEVPFKGEVALSSILTPETEFANKIVIELGRGCGCSCRFCAAGYVYRPLRIHRKKDLEKAVEIALGSSRNIGMLSACVSDIPGIDDLTTMILERGGAFSVSSLRADTLTGVLLDNLKKAGQRTVTIAPEAGSERLRKVINKHLTRDQIVDAVRLIAGRDFNIKLYFLIGLPTETQEDIHDIVNLVRVIKHTMVKESAPRGRIARLTLSINCFVPKPFTPFQWSGMDSINILKEKQKYLKTALKKEGGVRVHTDVPKWAYIQTLLAVGDRTVGHTILMAHKFGGNWSRAMHFSKINPDFFVYRPKEIDETLPWDFINTGIDKKHLIQEYHNALRNKETPMCEVGKCVRCGVCK